MREGLPGRVYSEDGGELPEVVAGLLRERGLTLAVAESCTGGLLAERLTSVPGASAFLERGYVTYSNRSKVELLGVDPGVLESAGAVSAETAAAMAGGARRAARTDIGVAITGIAGPDGGTPDKPVGMVCIAAAWVRQGKSETRVRTFNFVGGRDMVRFQASQAALDMVRRWLIETPQP